jgi:hypothetical protein
MCIPHGLEILLDALAAAGLNSMASTSTDSGYLDQWLINQMASKKVLVIFSFICTPRIRK